ncbi:MAG: hypothetical protein M3Q63_00980 [bacterium]|nr:hypothetical protein [bacterium]
MKKIPYWLKTNFVITIIIFIQYFLPVFTQGAEKLRNNISFDNIYIPLCVIISIWIGIFLADTFTNNELSTKNKFLKILKADVIGVISAVIVYGVLMLIGFILLKLNLDDLVAPLATIAVVQYVFIAGTIMSLFKFRRKNIALSEVTPSQF